MKRGRKKRINGLPLRDRPPTDEERLLEIKGVFLDMGEDPTSEKVANQFFTETRRILPGRFVKAVLQ